MPRRRLPPRPGALAELEPVRILTHIALVQLSFYSSATVLVLFAAVAAGQAVTWRLLFDWHTVRTGTAFGRVLGLVWLVNAACGAIAVLVVVRRSKLVLDFAITTHAIHLVFTTFYTHAVPSGSFWWLIQVLSASIMVLFGTWICRRRELRPLSFGSTATTTAAASSSTAAAERTRRSSDHIQDGGDDDDDRPDSHLLRDPERGEAYEMGPMRPS